MGVWVCWNDPILETRNIFCVEYFQQPKYGRLLQLTNLKSNESLLY